MGETVKTKLACVVASVAAAVAVTATLAGPAVASHRGVQCDAAYGYISDNQKAYLYYANINWSDWASDLAYHAIRVDLAGNETFHQYAPAGGGTSTTTSDGYDVYRRTVIQRGGYSSTYFQMFEYSHAGC